jgi:hypothetical protein
MSFFSSILEKLGIGTHSNDTAQAAPVNPGTAPGTTAPPPGNIAPPDAAISEVDVAAKLDALAASHTAETLNWRTSIVDLLKLLGLDSSLAKRKELAAELNYTGSTDDSAAMNMWLHKAVMKKLAENGGKVPAELH